MALRPRPNGHVRAWRLWCVALWLSVLMLVLSPRESAAGNIDLRWRTFETEHFIVHYYAGEEEVAVRVAKAAEYAWDQITVALGHRVYLKTHVVLIDTTDSANGRATAIPFPRIIAHATAPGALSSLEAHDDWIRLLITHEFVHVVHLDTVHGLPRLINAVFGFGVLGKIMSPNIVQPRSIVEGLATYFESARGSGGRQRSALFDMYLRMAVLEHQFQTIDQVSNAARVFPHGTSVYLYGLHFMHYIAARYGEDKLAELSHVYGGQTIPWGLNRSFRRILGIDFYRVWEEFREDTESRFLAQARAIRSRGLEQGRRLTFDGQSTRYPLWSHDGKFVYFFGDDSHTQAGVKRIPVRGSRVREGVGIGRQGVDKDAKLVVELEGVSAASWIGKSSQLVVDMVGYHDLRYEWSDLYVWRGGDRRDIEQLTFGKRASEPHVSPDGRTVVFRRNDTAQSRLAFLDLATGDVTEVRPSERIEQVYTPRWSPDGRRVAYSGWKPGGYRDIYIYDRVSETTQRVTADRHLDISPNWSPDGRYVVFSSDRSRVYNIYAYDTIDGSLHQVSNVLGGAMEPAVSPDGTKLAYVNFSSAGYDLWLMNFDRTRWRSVLASADDTPILDDPAPGAEVDPPLVRSSRGYRAYRTFFPRTLFPSALDVQSSSFFTEIGGTLEIADVLGFHSLIGSFSYIPQHAEPIGSVSYAFDRLFPSFRLGFGRGFAVRNGFTRYDYDYDRDVGASGYLIENYRERSTRAEVEMSLPLLRHPRRSLSASARYRFTRYTNLDEQQGGIDPNAPISQLPEVGDVSQVDLSMVYDNAEGTRFSYGNETGRRIAISLSVIDELLGGDYEDLQATGSIQQFLRMPWRGHQVLAMRLGGGFSAGGLQRRGAFFVGGLSQGQDVIRSLLLRTPYGTAGALRGFDPGRYAGRNYAVLNTEYRIPIVDVERGLGLVPAFLQRIVMIPFVDVGRAWNGQLAWRDLRVGVGGSLVFHFKLGYGESVQLFLEYAKGIGDEGTSSYRAMVAATF